MKSKKLTRMRRGAKARRKINELAVPRLSVHKTPRHIYVQLISADGKSTMAAASTLDSEIKGNASYSGNTDSAKVVGAAIAKRAIDAGVKKVAFDRSGFKYHGRLKALADAAREGGLEF